MRSVSRIGFVLLVALLFSITADAAMKPMKKASVRMIVVHHSDSTHGNVDEIRRWHMTRPKDPFDDIGYHFVITNGNGGPDGEIQTGRREDLQGAHAKNSGPDRNAFSLGICLVGKEDFTDAQKASLVVKLVELCRKYNITPSGETIQPHHENCPGKNLDLPGIIEQVRSQLDK